MYCKFLKVFRLPESTWSVASCEAYYQPYSPSLDEIQNFCCKQDNSYNCPVFKENISEKAPFKPLSYCEVS